MNVKKQKIESKHGHTTVSSKPEKWPEKTNLGLNQTYSYLPYIVVVSVHKKGTPVPFEVSEPCE